MLEFGKQMCPLKEESVDRLFVHCAITNMVWCFFTLVHYAMENMIWGFVSLIFVFPGPSLSNDHECSMASNGCFLQDFEHPLFVQHYSDD